IRVVSMPKNAMPAQQTAHFSFLFLRYLDDYFYQTIVRTQLAYETLPELGLVPTFERLPEHLRSRVEAILQDRLTPHINRLRELFLEQGMIQDIQVTDIHLPWQRLFEIGFTTKVVL